MGRTAKYIIWWNGINKKSKRKWQKLNSKIYEYKEKDEYSLKDVSLKLNVVQKELTHYIRNQHYKNYKLKMEKNESESETDPDDDDNIEEEEEEEEESPKKKKKEKEKKKKKVVRKSRLNPRNSYGSGTFEDLLKNSQPIVMKKNKKKRKREKDDDDPDIISFSPNTEKRKVISIDDDIDSFSGTYGDPPLWMHLNKREGKGFVCSEKGPISNPLLTRKSKGWNKMIAAPKVSTVASMLKKVRFKDEAHKDERITIDDFAQGSTGLKFEDINLTYDLSQFGLQGYKIKAGGLTRTENDSYILQAFLFEKESTESGDEEC